MRNFFPILGPISSFLHLSDVPNSYAGKARQLARVNVGENALEFSPLGTGALGYIGQISVMGNSSQAFAFTYMYAQQVYCEKTMQISRLHTIWQTSGAGTKLKMAVYADHAGSDRPDGAPLAATPELTYNSITSLQPQIGAITPLVVVEGSYYWLATITNGNWTQYTIFSGANASCQAWSNVYAAGFPVVSVAGGLGGFGMNIGGLE